MTTMKTHFLKLTCGLILLGMTASASAQSTLLSTMNSPLSSVSTLWTGGGFSGFAQVFTTGSQIENIGSVTVNEGTYSGINAAFSVSFYTDGGNHPGSLVNNGLFTGSAIAYPVCKTFQPLTLEANTTYWLVLNDSSTRASFTETSSANLVLSGNGGFAFGDSYYSLDQGASWAKSSSYIPMFTIDSAAPVPEPSTLALAGLGGLGTLLLRRRR